jgi:hypothetical protein
MYERPQIPQRWAVIRKRPQNVVEYLMPGGELTRRRVEAFWSARKTFAEHLRQGALKRYPGLQLVDLAANQDLL